jgi:hypothetical protein
MNIRDRIFFIITLILLFSSCSESKRYELVIGMNSNRNGIHNGTNIGSFDHDVYVIDVIKGTVWKYEDENWINMGTPVENNLNTELNSKK